MIELSHLYKTYPGPTHALRNISLQIKQGEFVFLTGPSGAGKTTLFRMITGLDQPTSGKIQILGNEFSNITRKDKALFRRQIGVVFQDFRLIPFRTIFENIELPLKIAGDSKSDIATKVQAALESVGMWEWRDQLPLQLSGGEQQRVAIARALIHSPQLLIADEPTGNVDPSQSNKIIDLFENACALGTTVLIATHDQSLVTRKNKRTLKLEAGSLTETSTQVEASA